MSAKSLSPNVWLIVLVITLSIWTVPPGALADAPTPTAPSEAHTTYQDPAGRFSAPVPSTWNVESAAAYVLLTDPERAIKVYLVAVQGDDAKAAIEQAWAVVDPAFNLKPQQISEPPAAEGLDQIVHISYATGDDKRLVIALAERLQESIVAMLIDGKTDAIVKRAAQVNVIASGLKISGIKETNLKGQQPKAIDASLLAGLESYIQEMMQRHQVPGAAVAIVQDGKVVYAKGFGVRQLGTDLPVTPETLMMIGSTSKTMTTMMMATVVDDGLMDWDTPAIQIMPGFAVADPQLSQQITMRNLVCACTGVPRRDLEIIFNMQQLTPEQVVQSLRTFQFFTKFGETFQYSNQMVAAGGYLAARAGGSPTDDLATAYVTRMQRRVFDPIGMTATTLSWEKVLASQNYATPHGLDLAGEFKVIPFDLERNLVAPMAPAGGVWSNALDMARYAITELQKGVAPDGRRVVSEENLMVTWTPQVAISADLSYGLGWMIGKYKGLQLLQHGGNTFGFTSDLAFLPEAQLGVVVLANGQTTTLFNEAVRYRLFELAFDLPAEYDASAEFSRQHIADQRQEVLDQLQPLDESALAPYLGRFVNDKLGEIGISLQAGRLTLDAGEFAGELRKRVDKEGKTTYLFFDPPLAGWPFEFKPDRDGQPTVVVDIATDVYVFTKQAD